MTLPTRVRQFRNIALLYGAILFVWIRIEDFQTLPVVIFGTTFSLLLLLNWVVHQFGGKVISVRYLPIVGGLFGAVWGLSAVITTTLLMFFKTASHSHMFPDYPPLLMLAMLERIPAWMLAGALVGLGGTLLWMALHDIKPVSEPSEITVSTNEPS